MVNYTMPMTVPRIPTLRSPDMPPETPPTEVELLRRFIADYFLARRQALLIELGQIEDLMGLPRTKEPKHRAKPPQDPKA